MEQQFQTPDFFRFGLLTVVLEIDLYLLFFCIWLQHIEDLTQEKFSLQRTLEASKVLAESLAAENSSLTGSYNQQVAVAFADYIV